MKRCVMCGGRVWFWHDKRYFKSSAILNPANYDEGWCHKSCEDDHFKFLHVYYLRPERVPAFRLYCKPQKDLGDLSGMAPCEPSYTVAINEQICKFFTEEEIRMVADYWSKVWSLDGK